MKGWSSTPTLLPILDVLSAGEESGTTRVAVKCVDMCRNTNGEGSFLDGAARLKTDAEIRKPRERTGLDTLVVSALNDVH